MRDEPVFRDLVLIGGGHAHALVLRMLGMRPIPGVRVSLISDVSYAPYSGMLPGLIAGSYSFDDAHIDLRRLCTFAGAVFIQAKVTGLDPAARRVHVTGRPALYYDVLSINTGSVPSTRVAGAREHAIPVKPIAHFLEAWETVLSRIEARRGMANRIAVVGGGAGGAELLLAVEHRLRTLRLRDEEMLFHMVQREPAILPTYPERARRLVLDAFAERRIDVHTSFDVVEVTENSVIASDGRVVPADFVLWVTQASPPEWPRDAGLAVDLQGFIQVDATLRSLSHENVFAAGDVACLTDSPRPKSGVFAVRAARPLAENLRRAVYGRPLRRWSPQRDHLVLLGTADGSAIGMRGPLVARSRLLWTWKDRIDRRFMERFSTLVPMPDPARGIAPEVQALNEVGERATMRCLGCAAKVGPGILAGAFRQLATAERAQLTAPGVVVGVEQPDDAAVLVFGESRIVQTVDYFPALVRDPFVFAQIAVYHCFSDIFAMGAVPHSALALMLVPFAARKQTEEVTAQLLKGTLLGLSRVGATLVGGHTAESPQLGLGFLCNGTLNAPPLQKQGGRAGDVVILTKPLGTGTIFAAEMRLGARARWIDGAIASMLDPNDRAAGILRSHRASSCTDVTGFGFLGHLTEMLAPGTGAIITVADVPALGGALECIAAGYRSSLSPENAVVTERVSGFRPDDPSHALLLDPQTSGGLIATVPADEADACVAALRAHGYANACVLGRLAELSPEVTRQVELR